MLHHLPFGERAKISRWTIHVSPLAGKLASRVREATKRVWAAEQLQSTEEVTAQSEYRCEKRRDWAKKSQKLRVSQQKSPKIDDFLLNFWDWSEGAKENGLKIKCTECNETMAYGRWSRHFNDYHHENNSQDQVVDGNVEAEKQPQPKKRAEPKKKVEP